LLIFVFGGSHVTNVKIKQPLPKIDFLVRFCLWQ